MAFADLSDQLPPQPERKELGVDLSVHMDFAYRSGLKQFSDRVIRVLVQREPLEGGEELQQPDKSTSQAYASGCVASKELTDSEHQVQAVDLEMQPVAGNEYGDEDSEGSSSYDIPVSSAVIAAHSMYFRRMLTSGLHESRSKDQPIVVALSPREAQSFNALIEFIYTHEISATVRSDKEELCWLLTIADRFETAACVQMCVQTLTSTPTTLADAVMYVSLPEPVKRCEAVRALIDTISTLTNWSLEEIAGADSVCDMEEVTIRRLVLELRGSDEYEEGLCKVCLQWFRYEGQDRWGAFAALLELLEFWRINPTFIREELESCPEVSAPERRALIDKLKSMEPPQEDKTPDGADQVGHGGAPAGHGLGPAVAGNNAPAVFPGGSVGVRVGRSLASFTLFLIILGAIEGFVVPVVSELGQFLSQADIRMTFL
ncbi:BTB POZ domain-containing protein [Klebsormidium nitens]|uniref:BTB POZ domain-containing protein n=1 Tax=Klebsormidium nitens TaxID=105231 RepID=A0A1Y1HKD5_KLENI|nr:BTB POZ domain-containing protein [Klebsormidium nitens]|eukprot:GAQ79044.1 BTB POZ domain-containing protein [Klebsormidium nitens]